MTVAPPRTTSRPVQSASPAAPEALIEEARARQRRRRFRLLVAAIVLAAVGGGIFGGFGGTAQHPPTIPVLERNLAGALARTKTTLVMRMHKQRLTVTPQYASAV